MQRGCCDDTRRTTVSAAFEAGRLHVAMSSFSGPRATIFNASSGKGPDLETRGVVPMPLVRHPPLQAAGPHDQVDRTPRDYTLQVGASQRRAVRPGTEETATSATIQRNVCCEANRSIICWTKIQTLVERVLSGTQVLSGDYKDPGFNLFCPADPEELVTVLRVEN